MFTNKKYWIDWIIKLIMIAMLMLLIGQLKAQQANSTISTDPALFFLYTKNAITAYELNFDTNEKLNKENPLKVKLQKLSGVSLKNGLSSIKSRYIGSDGFEIRLIAYQKMPIYLLKSSADHNYKLYIKDGGDWFLLKRVSVKINQGSFKQPKYQYIELVIRQNELKGE